MRNIRHLFIIAIFLSTASVQAQTTDLVRAYIDTYKQVAIAEMLRTGVPATITLAQGIYESTAGTSNLVLKSNNHFGIKCKSTWTGESVTHDDDARGECFRKYSSPVDSYKDHSDFLKNNSRYAFLFSLSPEDYQGWANGLKKAGYATNPKYPQALIKMVEDYNLQDYTLIALGKLNPADISAEVASTPVQERKITTVEVIRGNVVAEQQQVVEQAVYPSGVFAINETRVIYAPKGTSYLAIAQQYDVDLSKLFEFNDLPKAEQLGEDQLIFLQRKRKTGKDEFHIVQPGQTVHTIAQLQGIRLEALLAYNLLAEYQLPAAGEKLFLKTKAPAMPKLAVKTDYSITPYTRTKPLQ